MKKMSLPEIKKYYNTKILNKYIEDLIAGKDNDFIIVPLDKFNQEYFNLSEEYIKILIEILNNIGYFNPIIDRPITKNKYQDYLDNL